MILKQPIFIDGFENGVQTQKEVVELNLEASKFTPKAIMNAENKILLEGIAYPMGQMQESKKFLLIVASEMLGIKEIELESKLSGEDFLNLTEEVKVFFGGSALEKLILKLSEKSQ